MAAKPGDLAVTSSEGLARILAVSIVDGANKIDTNGSPINRAVKDALVLHARELLTMHGLKSDEVLADTGGSETGGNAHDPFDNS